jgi:hypothetical protein
MQSRLHVFDVAVIPCYTPHVVNSYQFHCGSYFTPPKLTILSCPYPVPLIFVSGIYLARNYIQKIGILRANPSKAKRLFFSDRYGKPGKLGGIYPVPPVFSHLSRPGAKKGGGLKKIMPSSA